MPLHENITSSWNHIQGFLFPLLREEVGPLSYQHERLVIVLDTAKIEAFALMWPGLPGRPQQDRYALARAFVAKMVLNLPTTSSLIDRLRVDATLRRLCGWISVRRLPSESTFSRAFAEFAASSFPNHVHEALIKRTFKDSIVGHISRDSTAIEARQKPRKVEKPEIVKRKRGRPKRGAEPVTSQPRRLTRQQDQALSQMLAELPTYCSVGAKRNAKGHTAHWIGYKLHIDTADGDIPISCLLTSASLHDSQAALPLARMTASRVTNLYDLMDSAYDAPEIFNYSRSLGHVPIIDANPRRVGKATIETESLARKNANYALAHETRYNQRSSSERVNSNLKDNSGGNHVRVRGAEKVFCHLMFGVLVITVEQIMRLVT
ncbi:MAG: transposase [Methylocystis sp.]